MPRALIIVIGGLVFIIGGIGAFLFFARSPEKTMLTTTATPSVLTPPTVEPGPATRPATPKPAAAAATPSPTAEPAPVTGTLIIESDVPDTGVFLDRVFVGTAPVTIKDIKPGPHGIRASATGFDGYDETIDVSAGTRRISLAFKDIKLEASIDVVHKHAIGSCSGTLKATPQGLRYDTTNAGDAFIAPLTSLETFAVDYLEKNLRVKIRNGKTLNFTDPEGKADRLYAFHKDVDKVRERLLKGR